MCIYRQHSISVLSLHQGWGGKVKHSVRGRQYKQHEILVFRMSYESLHSGHIIIVEGYCIMHKSDCFQSNAKIQNHLLIYVKSRASSPVGAHCSGSEPPPWAGCWSQGLSIVGVQVWAGPSHGWEPLLGNWPGWDFVTVVLSPDALPLQPACLLSFLAARLCGPSRSLLPFCVTDFSWTWISS